MFFDDWAGVVRVLVVGTCAYFSLRAALRVSGKRTLAKLNAFDFLVTVALGLTLATVLLSADVALVEGVVAMVLLVALQFLVAWLSVRSSAVEGHVKSEPTLVYHHGFLVGRMRRMRITEDEIRQAVRTAGHARLGAGAAVVLETDGSLSILTEVPAVLDHADTRDLGGPGA